MNEDPKDQMSASFRGTRDERGFFKNLATNIKGPSVSVVLSIWIIALVVITVWDAKHTPSAFVMLSSFLAFYLVILGRNSN